RFGRISRQSRFRICFALGIGTSVWSGVRQRFAPTLSSNSQVIRRFSPAGFRLPAFPSPRFLWLGEPGLLRLLRRLSHLLRQRLLLHSGLLSRLRLLRL